MHDLIGKFVCIHIPNYKSYLGKITDIDNDLFIVLFTDGDVIYYTFSDIQHILIQPFNELITSSGKYHYFLKNYYFDFNKRISKKEYDEINNTAFILCSLHNI
jgi:hypothetical protein